jgi:hypothetical protein
MDGSQNKSDGATLLPLMGSLTICYTMLLEAGMVIGHKLSDGKWPATEKYWVVAAVALIAGIYKLTSYKQHKIYVNQLFNRPLTPRQIFLMVCFIMGWVILGVWMMMGPPGPEFRPA